MNVGYKMMKCDNKIVLVYRSYRKTIKILYRQLEILSKIVYNINHSI